MSYPSSSELVGKSGFLFLLFFFLICLLSKIIRICHDLVDRNDNSSRGSLIGITRLCRVVPNSGAKQWREGQKCLSYPRTHVGFFFLHTFEFQRFDKSILP